MVAALPKELVDKISEEIPLGRVGEPNCISITVNNANYTTELIKKSGKFNISILSEYASFEIFKHFGFQSGKEVDKIDGYSACKRSANGIYYATEGVIRILAQPSSRQSILVRVQCLLR